MQGLDLHAPKLHTLALKTDHSLKHVRLQPNEGSLVEVDTWDCNLDEASMDHLQQHPRVGPERHDGSHLEERLDSDWIENLL